MRRRFDPPGPLSGTFRAPPDKSISHRAALIGAMGQGTTRVSGYLEAGDTLSTLAAIKAAGAHVERSGGEVTIRGTGIRGVRPAAIDVGNAGTLLRVLPGWLAGQEGGTWTLDGDASIRRRPVDRVLEPLRRMGAVATAREDRFPPLRVTGSPLAGIDYRLPVASAQVKSCVLLAGLLAAGRTVVRESIRSRDHTERMLAAAGAEVEVREAGAGAVVAVRPALVLEPDRIRVPGDLSSAAFLLVAAAIVPGSRIRAEKVGLNPTRTGILRVLERMGAEVTVEEESTVGGEPIGSVEVAHAPLAGATVAADQVPETIDELPLVGLLGAIAEGETAVSGASELRLKESDRIATVVGALRSLGVDAEERPDGFAVGGGGLRGGRIDAAGDHRIAMLGAVAGLAAPDGVEVDGMEAASISWPGFARELAGLVA